MKKLYTLIASCLFTWGVTAQITVTQWDVVMSGDQVIQAQDTVPGAMTSGSSGAHVTWDFSTLSADRSDTLNFTSPQWTPQGADYPNSNLAVEIGGAFMYLRNDATGLGAVGQSGDFFGTGSAINLHINPADYLAQWPMQYQGTWTAQSIMDETFDGSAFGADSVRIKQIGDKSISVDAHGTVITPIGSFFALRNFIMEINTDTTWAYAFGMWNVVSTNLDTTYRYSWWSNDPATGFPLVEMDYDMNADTAYSVSWLQSSPTQNGVEEHGAENIVVYPNPAKDIVTVQGMNDAGTITVLDMNGRAVLEVGVSAGNQTIDLSDLAKGSYIMRWRSIDGTSEKQTQLMKK